MNIVTPTFQRVTDASNGTMHVDLSQVVCVKRGEWSNERQDYRATLVFGTGLHLETGEWQRDLVRRLDCLRGWSPEIAP